MRPLHYWVYVEALEAVKLVGAEAVVTWAGALSLEVHSDGSVQPYRLNHEDAPLYHGLHNGSESVFARAATPAGVRLVLLTTADAIELTFCWRGERAQSENMRVDLCLGNHVGSTSPQHCPGAPLHCQSPRHAPVHCLFSLCRRRQLADSQGIGAIGLGAVQWSSPTTLRFVGLPLGQNRVELWLPQQGNFRVVALRIPTAATASRFTDGRPRWITYGSSITHCGAAHSPSRTWPATCARTADVNLTCLGFGGNCNLDPLVARAIRDQPADAINLKLGINMMASHNKRTFIPAAIGFIATIRDGHPTTPIVVTSPIFSRPRETANPAFAAMPTAFQHGHAFTLVEHREALSDLVQVLRARGDHNIHYRSGLELFGEADEPMLPDLLHPNGDG